MQQKAKIFILFASFTVFVQIMNRFSFVLVFHFILYNSRLANNQRKAHMWAYLLTAHSNQLSGVPFFWGSFGSFCSRQAQCSLSRGNTLHHHEHTCWCRNPGMGAAGL